MIENLNNRLELLAHQTTKEGKTECGDSYFYTVTDDYFVCVLADGLGSGKYAHEASSAVVEVVEENHHEDVDTLMKYCNEVLYQKRGAAVSIFKVYFKSRELVYSCVGNIRFFLYSPQGKLIYPLPVTGYLSGKPQVFNTQRFFFEPESKFLVYSDGFDIHGAKSLLKGYRSTQGIADEIRRDYQNTMDDATFILGSFL
ncbi:PP2C family serine/threonine-protein phosphatase [Mesobacillus foraminis]|jgi:negative regulator of sigma-B (phosphoserine phosphatase)|uniref:Negative regulator of sigma-B (Phosphoserine phosphatase) n=1 Tax=Mesobacillus foraminis TaxID=279826 RepID=A0A4R2AWG9_9BACI|nr:PP2C family serine/threonine-protein phosphatase [Mesobacillus foraminis]MBT2759614.1 SpoIIE family protein phosphatase [Mesobacillus foraminis]TCN17995.1 negative regulator of sigma-B (phosphoserine phosphatase) [Mesobacillus foraminis]